MTTIKEQPNKHYTFIDLFAGCGGLSEGFYRQGFKSLAHVEINHFACETLRKRMQYYGYRNFEKEVLEYDITNDDILEKIDEAPKPLYNKMRPGETISTNNCRALFAD